MCLYVVLLTCKTHLPSSKRLSSIYLPGLQAEKKPCQLAILKLVWVWLCKGETQWDKVPKMENLSTWDKRWPPCRASETSCSPWRECVAFCFMLNVHPGFFALHYCHILLRFWTWLLCRDFVLVRHRTLTFLELFYEGDVGCLCFTPKGILSTLLSDSDLLNKQFMSSLVPARQISIVMTCLFIYLKSCVWSN